MWNLPRFWPVPDEHYLAAVRREVREVLVAEVGSKRDGAAGLRRRRALLTPPPDGRCNSDERESKSGVHPHSATPLPGRRPYRPHSRFRLLAYFLELDLHIIHAVEAPVRILP